MTISIANTLITNTFEYWRSRTNELAYAMSSNTVTTGGSPAVGNAFVTGLFFANTLSSNTLSVTGASTFSNTLGITGAGTFSNTLSVTGAATLSNTISVTGASTFSNTVGITGAATLSSTLNLTGAATFANTLAVTGPVTLSNTLSVTSNTSLSNVTISSSLSVTGNVYLGTTAVINSSYYTGTASNANTLGGLTPTSYVNTSVSHANAAAQDVNISGVYNNLGAILATTGVTAGGYGSSVNAISIVVDAKGRVTSISNTSINVNTALGYTPLGVTASYANSAAQDVSIGGTFNSLTAVLATTGVAAATYGDGSAYPVITVDAKGRLTNVTTLGINSASLSVNNAVFLSGVNGNNFVQNTDSRTLSGNLVFSSILDANTTNAAIIISGGVLIAKSLYANGTSAAAYFNNANIGGTLGVVGAATFSNIVSITGTLTANGGTFNGRFANAAAQDVIISGTSSISLGANLATIQGLTDGTYGNTTAIPTITIDTKGRINAVSLSAVSIPTGTVNTSGNFTIAGNLVFSSTLEANGIGNAAVTFAGGVGIAKSLYANGSGIGAYFNNANIAGTLGVVGATTVANTLNITGLTTLSANLVMGGNHVTTPTLKSYREFTTNTVVTTSFTADLSLSNMFLITGTGGSICTISFSNPPATGISQSFSIVFKQPASGSSNVVFPNTVRFSYGDTPVLSTVANARDVFTFITFDSGTTYLGAHSMANVAS